MTEPRRRFPPPWSVEETAPCFIVRDVNKQALAFVYNKIGREQKCRKKPLNTKKAQEHLTHASRHHGEAAKHHEGGHHEKAAHHAHVARAHVIHARGHAEEAVKAHHEEHGNK